MLKTIKNVLTALSFIFIFIFVSFAQQPSPTPRPDDLLITDKDFRTKVIEVKYRDVDSLAKVLRPLLSGFRGSLIPSAEFKTLTVRDYPENIATIDEALKRLDKPAAPRQNIELHMYVLVASNTSGSSGTTVTEVPAELKDVLTQLRGTLTYRNYELATSVVQRLTETSRGLSGKGTAEIARPAGGNTHLPSQINIVEDTNLPYQYHINSVTIASTSTGVPIIQIGEFSFYTMFSLTGMVQTQVQTALNLRDGEKVVVGTAAMGNSRALVIVLTAKLVT